MAALDDLEKEVGKRLQDIFTNVTDPAKRHAAEKSLETLLSTLELFAPDGKVKAACEAALLVLRSVEAVDHQLSPGG